MGTHLAEELFLQLVGPALMGLQVGCQVPNVGTLQHHLHTTNSKGLLFDSCNALSIGLSQAVSLVGKG